MNLILGFYRPDSGTVGAAGAHYDDIAMGELRRHIGIVFQEPVMFDESVAARAGGNTNRSRRDQPVRWRASTDCDRSCSAR